MSKELKLDYGTCWPDEYDWETQFAEALNGAYGFVTVDAGKLRGVALAYKELRESKRLVFVEQRLAGGEEHMTVWLVFEMDEHNNRNDVIGVFATRKAAEQWVDARKNPLPFYIEDWVVLGEKS